MLSGKFRLPLCFFGLCGCLRGEPAVVYHSTGGGLQAVPTQDIYKNTTEITLDENLITHLGSGDLEFPDLVKLSLKKNKIVSIKQRTFCVCIELKELWLAENNLTSFPPLECLSNALKTLDISGNFITSLNDTEFPTSGSKLKDLLMGGNDLEGDITPLGVFSNSLEKLELNKNKLVGEDLTFLYKFVNLKSLDISKNKDLRDFPKNFCQRCVLAKLDAAKCNIQEIPMFTEKITENLQELYLEENKITSLETGNLANITSLNVLNLGKNPVQNFAGFADWQFQSNLQKLYLDDITLTEIPPGAFENFNNLEILDLSSTGLSHIPNLARSGETLQELILSSNNIQEVPLRTMTSLTALELIDLSHNQISQWEDIRWGLSELKETLKKLDLNHNHLDVIDLDGFSALEVLNIDVTLISTVTVSEIKID